MTDELLDLDATAQAELVRAGEIRPRELIDAAIARIEEVDPRLNAVIHRQFDRARSDADRMPSGPFGGVPFLLKDFGGWEAGEPYCAGTAALRDAGFRARVDSPLAIAFRRAGLIPLGRTNTPELAMMGTTEPVAFGPTHNPWELGRSPGGSSGGSAAAVAARCVAAAHATDIAGSIRIPSAHCGLVGLKSTRYRIISSGPVGAPVGMNTEGVVTRTVRDTAGLLDAVAAQPGRHWWSPAALPGPLTAEVGADPGTLKIGLCTTAFNGADVDESCASAATATASLLGELGHSVAESWPVSLASGELHDAMTVALAATADFDLRYLSAEVGRELGEADVEANTWRVISGSRSRTPADLLAALDLIERMARESAVWWAEDGFDLLVTPTTAEAPTRHGEYVSGYRPGRASAFTRVFNATGQPSLSLPLGWPDDGMPRGVQLVAAHGREDVLIRIGSALEEAAPWSSHRPPL
jgi:amidase